MKEKLHFFTNYGIYVQSFARRVEFLGRHTLILIFECTPPHLRGPKSYLDIQILLQYKYLWMSIKVQILNSCVLWSTHPVIGTYSLDICFGMDTIYQLVSYFNCFGMLIVIVVPSPSVELISIKPCKVLVTILCMIDMPNPVPP